MVDNVTVFAHLAAWVLTNTASPLTTPDAPPVEEQCENRATVYADGRAGVEICAHDADRLGLTWIDLRDQWMPRVLLGDRDQPRANAYRATWVGLAKGELAIEGFAREAEHDRYFEPFGIPPAFSWVVARLNDHDRHRCHARIDHPGFALRAAGKVPENPQDGASAKHLGSTELRALQEHLVCEKLMGKREINGVFDPKTKTALGIYRRKHLLLGTKETDGETFAMLITDSRELEFRAGLRALRERVVDTTGLIEDGSARLESGQVLGRKLNPPSWQRIRGWEAVATGAPDLISPATEAAALALGWNDPQAFVYFFEHSHPDYVAVKLPPLPDYHRPTMELRAEIDRGSLGARGRQLPGDERRETPDLRRPTLTLWAKDGTREIALLRWPTTVGGWKKERSASGKVMWKFKESPTGEFFWRDLVAAPVWYPPASTPDVELLHEPVPGRYRLRESLIGPGYRSAYGLVMLVEHRVAMVAKKEVWIDTLVRTHGSVDYRSLQNGASHGCHRLFNHLALRLGSFLLAHHSWQQMGPLREVYTRSFTWKGKTYGIFRASQGDGYRLEPPIPVRVFDRVGENDGVESASATQAVVNE